MDEIIALENRRIEAMIKQDTQALSEILADDLSYTHSTARVETKAEFISSLTSGRTKYQSIQRDDVKVRQYGDTAVVTVPGQRQWPGTRVPSQVHRCLRQAGRCLANGGVAVHQAPGLICPGA